MTTDLLVKGLTALAPVLVLLLMLDRLDIFNLIKFRTIGALLAVGGALAAASYFAGGGVKGMAPGFPIPDDEYSLYIAPAVEETLKALPIIILFAMNRLGFKLDSALAGFAIGAGFSAVENIVYLSHPEVVGAVYVNYSAWLVRGFGTAVMHGGATALFAAASHEMTERQSGGNATHYWFNPLLFLPGLAGAYVLHSAFNHIGGTSAHGGLNEPTLAMALTLLLVPLALFFILSRGERATQAWIKTDRDAHRTQLQLIRSGQFAESEQGRKLRNIAARFQGAVSTADIMAYLELKMELVLRNEEIMLLMQEGQEVPIDSADQEKIARLHQMERRLGAAVLAAAAPVLGFSRNDLWELEHFKARIARTPPPG